MKKKLSALLMVVLVFIMSSTSGFAQTPFEVNTSSSQSQKVIAADDSPSTSGAARPGKSGEKEVTGFFKILKGVLDILAAVVEGVFPSASAGTFKEISGSATSTGNGADTVATSLTGKNASGNDSTAKTVSGNSAGKTVSGEKASAGTSGSTVSGNAPAAVIPDPAKGKAVTVGSAKFKTWFNDAAKYCSDWEFPSVTNKYGQKITQEDYLRAIIWIESRGVHQSSGGKLTKSWAGAMGFMQLMPNTARGLKIDPKDGAQNLKGGAKYLKEIFNGGQVGKKDGVEKLIMGACGYNLGPFSKSMKLTWNELKASNKIPVETRGYGLKMKMCLGLELTADERVLVQKWLVGPGQTVDSLIAENYTNTRGIAS